MVPNLEVDGGDYNLLDYCTFRVVAMNDVENVKGDKACRKADDQQNLLKIIM